MVSFVIISSTLFNEIIDFFQKALKYFLWKLKQTVACKCIKFWCIFFFMYFLICWHYFSFALKLVKLTFKTYTIYFYNLTIKIVFASVNINFPKVDKRFCAKKWWHQIYIFFYLGSLSISLTILLMLKLDAWGHQNLGHSE